jgi:quinoprotein glucose dehydrogenase
MRDSFIRLLAVCFLGVCAPVFLAAQDDPGGTRYSPLSQINTQNVQDLKVAWVYHTKEVKPGGMSGNGNRIDAFESRPVVVGTVLYFSTPSSRVIALNAETGAELWTFDPQAGKQHRTTAAHRGVAYWQGPSGEGRILYGTADGLLIALDAKSGKPCRDFGDNGIVPLRPGVADNFPNARYSVTSPPAIYKDLVITGAELQEYPSRGPSGAIRAFDVRTGKLAWEFQTIAQPDEAGHETWDGNSSARRSGVNVWSLMSVDRERGLVFLPIGSPSYDFYGADRKGNNLYGNSIVALDAKNGQRVWYFQVVHHDIWDYDLPAQPTLVDITRNGESIPAVAQVTKTGYVFVFDRRTGKPVFPIEERPVPQSDVPGEWTSPTQPFPSKPPALARQSVTESDLNQTTAESKQYCQALFRSLANHGMFTPYGTKLTLVMPGTLGGATWSGASFDPKTHYLYVNTNEYGAVGQMKPQPRGSPEAYRRSSPWGEYARFADEQGRPCQKPPWGLLNAIDLDRGEIVWRTPLGNEDKLHSAAPTGTPNLGGSIVTAGGLVFIGASWDRKFRAFSAADGKVLWETQLEASAHATPVTYLGKRSGKQFVVIAAGGGGFFPGPVSDTLVAFSLSAARSR